MKRNISWLRHNSSNMVIDTIKLSLQTIQRSLKSAQRFKNKCFSSLCSASLTDRQTDGQTDGSTDRKNFHFLGACCHWISLFDSAFCTCWPLALTLICAQRTSSSWLLFKVFLLHLYCSFRRALFPKSLVPLKVACYLLVMSENPKRCQKNQVYPRHV